jgi:hypothetical protein
MNDVVVHRIFAAGLDLQAALGLIGDHRGASKICHALDELDQAIKDTHLWLMADEVIPRAGQRLDAAGPVSPGWPPSMPASSPGGKPQATWERQFSSRLGRLLLPP